jgi:hypothetical protein
VAAEVGCVFTKVLIPWIEREVGPAAVAAILAAAGRSREYMMAEYNAIPLDLADDLVRLAMRLMKEPDEERWARRFAEFLMEWKSSRDERSWAGAYTKSFGSPRAIYAGHGVHGFVSFMHWESTWDGPGPPSVCDRLPVSALPAGPARTRGSATSAIP